MDLQVREVIFRNLVSRKSSFDNSRSLTIKQERITRKNVHQIFACKTSVSRRRKETTLKTKSPGYTYIIYDNRLIRYDVELVHRARSYPIYSHKLSDIYFELECGQCWVVYHVLIFSQSQRRIHRRRSPRYVSGVGFLA